MDTNDRQDNLALKAAKDNYYVTMIDGVHTSSEHNHWKATQHLEAVAQQCIENGTCLDDPYIQYIKQKRQGRVITDRLTRNRTVETVGELREAIADLPDDLRLIKTTGIDTTTGLKVLVGTWSYRVNDGQQVKAIAVRVR